MKLLRVVALVLACLAVPTTPKKVQSLDDARAVFQQVQDLMVKVKPEADKEITKIKTLIHDAARAYEITKKRIHTLMQADAQLNSIPIESLDPKNYGLGPDPSKSKGTLQQESREAVCSHMSKTAASLLEDTYSVLGGTPPKVNMDPMDLVEELAGAGDGDGDGAGYPNTDGDGDGSGSTTESPQVDKLKQTYANLQRAQAREVATQVQEEVDKKIITYLKQASKSALAKSLKFGTEENSFKKDSQEIVTGHLGTPVTIALAKVKIAESYMDKKWKQILHKASHYSATAATALDTINTAHVLYIPEDLHNADLMHLIKEFQKAVDLLTDVEPLHSFLTAKLSKIKNDIKGVVHNLKYAAAEPEAGQLQNAMQHPDFMLLSQEFKRQLTFEKEGLNVAKKVIEACQDPGSVKINWAGLVKNATKVKVVAAGGFGGNATGNTTVTSAAGDGAALLEEGAGDELGASMRRQGVFASGFGAAVGVAMLVSRSQQQTAAVAMQV
jgi:RNA binding exosome subunit